MFANVPGFAEPTGRPGPGVQLYLTNFLALADDAIHFEEGMATSSSAIWSWQSSGQCRKGARCRNHGEREITVGWTAGQAASPPLAIITVRGEAIPILVHAVAA
jgi:hypothetical protein